jgi:quercetin dioxygenase-like cupin family protein
MRIKALGLYMRVLRALVLAVGVVFFARLSVSAEDARHEHSPGVIATEVYREPVPGVPGKVARMAILQIPPHRVVDPHCHYGFEYGIVTQGSLMVKSGGADYESKSEGDVFSVPPKIPMTVKNDTDQPAQLYSVLVVDEHQPFVDYLDGPNGCQKD